MSVQSLQRIALATRIKKVVVGGPGVGKSWAALQRLQALVCDKQVLPENILIAAPTYNRAHVLQAASDIVLPLGSMVKVHTPSTFVSFVLKDLLSVPGTPTVVNRETLISLAAKNMHKKSFQDVFPLIEPRRVASQLVDLVDHIYDADVNMEKYTERASDGNFDHIARCVEDLLDLKRNSDVVSTSGLRRFLLEHLRSFPSSSTLLAEHFSHIIIDDFQDFSLLDLGLMYELASNGKIDSSVWFGDYNQRTSSHVCPDGVPHIVEKLTTQESTNPHTFLELKLPNKRSSKAIYVASKKLMSTASESHREEAEYDDRDGGRGTVEFTEFANDRDELRDVATRVQNDIRQGLSVGVFSRNVEMAKRTAAVLEEMNVPVLRHGSVQQPLIVDESVRLLLAVLQSGVNPSDSVAASTVLIDGGYLDELYTNGGTTLLVSILERHRRSHVPLRKFLEDIANGAQVCSNSEIGPTLIAAANEIHTHLQEVEDILMRVEKSESRLSDAVLHFMHIHSELRNIFAAPRTAEEELASANLDEFLHRAREISRTYKSMYNVAEIVSRLRDSCLRTRMGYYKGGKINREELTLDSARSLVGMGNYESELVPYAHVLTMHGARDIGLQFDNTYILGLVDSIVPGVKRRNAFHLDEGLASEIRGAGKTGPQLSLKEAHVVDERRILHAALSRSRTSAFLSSSKHREGRKRVSKPSRFIEDMSCQINNSGRNAVAESNPVEVGDETPLRISLSSLSDYVRSFFRSSPSTNNEGGACANTPGRFMKGISDQTQYRGILGGDLGIQIVNIEENLALEKKSAL